MSGRNTLKLVVAMALVSACGIVGLLLAVDARFDGPLLALAALPLLVGAWRWRAQAGQSGRAGR